MGGGQGCQAYLNCIHTVAEEHIAKSLRMSVVLSIAANGHHWLTFKDELSSWEAACQWLCEQRFQKSGDIITGLDEAILPAFVREQVSLASGHDHWSGHYLLAQCTDGDMILAALARYLGAVSGK
ncbi:hypothetical protein CO614_11365 [Lysobacteraceae bacterium NML120232]|nr:hypothetical protein CO614_11365 [Xanthomonadaceae bacterium NML120232]PJK10961.1 hypothetical protein CO608_00315 [Xanthomonadaceae bacterium NML08-0793]